MYVCGFSSMMLLFIEFELNESDLLKNKTDKIPTSNLNK